MPFVNNNMKKAEIPDVVWEHEKYLFKNHKIFYPPVLKMFAQIKKAYTLAKITKALVTKDPDSLIDTVTAEFRGKEIPIDAEVDWAATNELKKADVINYEDTDEILIGLYEQAATEIGAAEQAALAMTTSFRLANPLVYEQIRKRAGALITDVDSTTRRAVVEMVKQFTEGNYAAGASMPQLAREIRAGIGMHPTHAKTWWMDHRRRLIDNGMSGANLAKASERYAKKLINYRSRMIARTEMAFAMERGRAEAWTDAQKKKFLPPNQKKKWYALLDGKTSKICQALNDTEVGLEEMFYFDEGLRGAVMGAPAHPFCRSVVILVRDYDWRRA